MKIQSAFASLYFCFGGFFVIFHSLVRLIRNPLSDAICICFSQAGARLVIGKSETQLQGVYKPQESMVEPSLPLGLMSLSSCKVTHHPFLAPKGKGELDLIFSSLSRSKTPVLK